jgi:hypothetical protein
MLLSLIKTHKNAPHIYSLFCNCKFKIYCNALALIIYCTECDKLPYICIPLYPVPVIVQLLMYWYTIFAELPIKKCHEISEVLSDVLLQPDVLSGLTLWHWMRGSRFFERQHCLYLQGWTIQEENC